MMDSSLERPFLSVVWFFSQFHYSRETRAFLPFLCALTSFIALVLGLVVSRAVMEES